MRAEDIFKIVADISQTAGVTAYVVGGYVRDRLREIPEKKDIDMVIEGDALAFAKQFAEKFPEQGSLVEFPDFKTARFVFTADEMKEEILEVEFAAARTEVYQPESRKPVVTSTTIEQDLSRRDFTVNAIAQKITNKGLEKVVDPFDGQKDLAAHVLRTPLDPDETFSDDPLRMLRAARFAAQLEFAIAPEVLQAIHRNRARLHIVSAERISEELIKLLAAPKPSIGLTILYQTKLIDEFLPEVSQLSGVEEAYGYSHKDNLAHTFAVVDNIAERSQKPLLRFAGLVHDIAKPDTKQFVEGRGWTFDMHEHLGKKMTIDIGKRLRMSKDDVRYMAKLVRWHLQPIALMDDGVTDSAVRRLIINVGDDLVDLLILCRADITTGNQKKKEHRLKNYDYLERRIGEVIEKDKLRAFQSPVRGDEIMQLSGLKPGPTIGKMKKEIERAILDGEIPNEYELAKAYFEKILPVFLNEAEEWERAV
ncbi:MAG: hypothetical protein A3J66_01545 [Candidatus Magasanikbacteria bacterium RIFCSPHIGHO2_02_FULL_47_14]|uniref:tRNA nucleotidyltransferase n=1 Tax=Candidatus Magasanikbacteria bacterium RIFCSPHIGHO2_02_FULL_47_14 TaxID=1798680 RepID=A0A1F6M7V7_9BACT|nr:MAG: hypothetical protein A3J66_01545 [Candidatus Magasanikbacteria bacterium RIFCSPHIGHO2_02_FULL_47_14]